MGKLLLIVSLTLALGSVAQTYPNHNITLLSNVNPETINNWYGVNTKYAGCYGWHNPVDDKEYAILGSTTGNHFIEITDPANPVVRDFVPGASQTNLWREIQTYQHYAYLISDDNGSDLQIVDMSYLPDSVHVVYESTALFTKAHTLFVEGTKLYIGGITLAGGAGTYPMAVYDLADPVNPILLRTLNQDYPSIGYVHDMFVKNDTVYASTGNPGLFIFKYNSNNTFTMLASFTNYLQVGYNHSSYITPDSKTLVFCDEVPTGLAAKVLDVSDFSNLTLKDTIVSHPGATAHNPYVTNDYHAVISYYQDGVYIYDISDPSNAVMAGFFDTDPEHGDNDNYSNSNSYQGCWGAYPFLPSGVLLASDMQHGLFILDMSAALSVKSNGSVENYVHLYPNPSSDLLQLVISGEEKGNLELVIYDITGKKIRVQEINKAGSFLKTNLDISGIAPGAYVVRLAGGKTNYSSKLVIAR
jgi:choice-of-anchor B domain-containing protein